MSLAFPWFLFALFALIIPILIHLYNWRQYKKVQFPDISMLEHIVMETKKYAKIKHWKILLSRLLLLTLLVFAFTQPFWTSNQKENHQYILYIDNSYSMSFGKGQKNKLEQSKEASLQFIKQLPAQAQVKVLSNNEHSDWLPSKDAISFINQINFSTQFGSLNRVFNNLEAPCNVYIFSDLQAGTLLLDSNDVLFNNEQHQVYFIPNTYLPEHNIYFDSVYFLQPNIDIKKPNPIVVQLKNAVDSSVTTRLQVYQQGKTTSFTTIDEQESSSTDTLQLMFNDEPWQELMFTIAGDQVGFDDTFRMSIQNKAAQNIVLLNEGAPNNYLQTALQTFEKYQIHNNNIANPGIRNIQANLIILQNVSHISNDLLRQLENWWSEGKHIVLFPSEQLPTSNFNNTIGRLSGIVMESWEQEPQTVYSLLQQHPIFAASFEKLSDQLTLPITQKRIKVNASLKSSPQNLMSFRDGLPYLSTYKIGNGQFTLLSAPLNTQVNNFATSEYFAPFLYNIAQQSGAQSSYTIQANDAQAILVPNAAQSAWKIQLGNQTLVPPQKAVGNWVQLFPQQYIQQPGYFKAFNDADTQQYTLAINISKQESILNFKNTEAIAALFSHPQKVNFIKNDTQIFTDNQTATWPLWRTLVLIGLLALIVETFLITRKK